MIAWLAGTLAYKSPAYCVVDVGGVGYRVFFSLNGYSALPEVGQRVETHVYTYVREDALHLYGFLDPAERELFEELLTVSGVGPRLALTILSGATLPELQAALESGDSSRLLSIPGVGKKTAARLVLELRDRIGRRKQPSRTAFDGQAENDMETQAVSALVNLGFKLPVAQAAVREARSAGHHNLESLIRDALRRAAA